MHRNKVSKLKLNVDTRRKWLSNLQPWLVLKAFDDYVKLRWIKLRLVLRREENRRTRRKTLEAQERPTRTILLT